MSERAAPGGERGAASSLALPVASVTDVSLKSTFTYERRLKAIHQNMGKPLHQGKTATRKGARAGSFCWLRKRREAIASSDATTRTHTLLCAIIALPLLQSILATTSPPRSVSHIRQSSSPVRSEGGRFTREKRGSRDEGMLRPHRRALRRCARLRKQRVSDAREESRQRKWDQ